MDFILVSETGTGDRKSTLRYAADRPIAEFQKMPEVDTSSVSLSLGSQKLPSVCLVDRLGSVIVRSWDASFPLTHNPESPILLPTGRLGVLLESCNAAIDCYSCYSS